MKVDELLNINCTDKSGLDKLRKALTHIPQFSKYNAEDITQEQLEKYMNLACKKHNVMLSYVSRTPDTEYNYWSFMIKNAETHEWLKTVFAISMFEGFAKSVIYAYAYIKRKEKENNES